MILEPFGYNEEVCKLVSPPYPEHVRDTVDFVQGQDLKVAESATYIAHIEGFQLIGNAGIGQKNGFAKSS